MSLKSRSFLLHSLQHPHRDLRLRRTRPPQDAVRAAADPYPDGGPGPAAFHPAGIILPWLGYNGAFSHGAGQALGDNLFERYISDAEYAAKAWPTGTSARLLAAYGFILAWPLSVYNVFTDKPMPWWLVINCLLQTFIAHPACGLALGQRGRSAAGSAPAARSLRPWATRCAKMPHGPLWNRLNMIGQAVLGWRSCCSSSEWWAGVAGVVGGAVFHLLPGREKFELGKLITFLSLRSGWWTCSWGHPRGWALLQVLGADVVPAGLPAGSTHAHLRPFPASASSPRKSASAATSGTSIVPWAST